MSEGVKHDQGKPRVDLLPFDALLAVTEVMEAGLGKYDARNWERGMHWSRPFASMMRHMWAWFQGQDQDPETGLSHLAHAACCVLFLLAYHTRGMKEFDNRPGESPTN